MERLGFEPRQSISRTCTPPIYLFIYLFIKRLYLFIFREREREGKREGEKHQCVVASPAALTGDLACNAGMCPDREPNQ